MTKRELESYHKRAEKFFKWLEDIAAQEHVTSTLTFVDDKAREMMAVYK